MFRIVLMFIIFGFPISAQANENKLSMEITTDFVTEYVFRGVTLAGEAIQPSVSITYDGFTIGAWGSVPLLSLIHI